jgi:hypothetical protein
MADANDNPLRVEDLDDNGVRRLFHERMIEGAQKLHAQESTRLIAEGIVDSEGRLLKAPAATDSTTDDGGGW